MPVLMPWLPPELPVAETVVDVVDVVEVVEVVDAVDVELELEPEVLVDATEATGPEPELP
jgi:hypothetical protein